MEALLLLAGISHGITAALVLAVLVAPGLSLRGRAILWLLLISATAFTFVLSSWDLQAGAGARRFARVLAAIGFPVMWGLVQELFGAPRNAAWRLPTAAAVVVGLIAALAGEGHDVRRLAFAVTLLQLSLTGIVGCWLWTLMAHRSDDLDSWRRGSRIVLAVGMLGVVVLAVGLQALGIPSRSNGTGSMLLLIFQIVVKLACLRAFIGNPSPIQRLFDLGEAVEPSPRWPLAAVATWPATVTSIAAERRGAAQAAIARQVSQVLLHVEQKQFYRKPGLGVGELADELKQPEAGLRALISGHLGFRNFSSFMNHYRLREVAGALRDPADAHQPADALALKAGFQSIGTFRRSFAHAFGVTPEQYRDADEPQSANVSVLSKVIEEDAPGDSSVTTTTKL